MKKRKLPIIYIITFIVPIIVVMISFAVSGFLPFGSKDIFTASGNEKFITNYYRLHDYVHGVYKSDNIEDLWFFYMTDPVNLIVLLFPRTLLISILSILYSIKLGASSLFFSIFLSKRKNENECTLSKTSKKLIVIVISLAYALSGYMLVYGANISFLSVIAIFPLIILLYEKLINDGDWKYYYLALIISFIFSTYATLVILLFNLLYLINTQFKNNKHILKTICYKILAELLAFGSSSIIVIPALLGNASKDFFFEDPPYNYNILNFFDIFKRFLTLSEPSSTTDTAYGIDLALGILSIFMLFVYLANPKYDIFSKIKKMIPITILTIATSMTGINSIMNLYAKSMFNSCFFAFELIFLLLIISYETLNDINNINPKIIIACSSITAVIVVFAMIFAHKYVSTTPFSTSIEVIILYGVILYVICSKKSYSGNATIILSTIGILEIILTFSVGVFKLSNVNSEYKNTYSANTYALESYIKSLNKDYNIIDYNKYDNYFNPVLNYISKTNYVFCPAGSDKPDACLKYVDTMGNVDIYTQENTYDGYIYADSNILDWTYGLSTPYMSTNYLMSILTNSEQNIFHKTTAEATLLASTNYNDGTSENQQVSYVNISYDFDEKTDIYSSYINSLYVGDASENSTIEKLYDMTIYYGNTYNAKTTYFYAFNKDAFYSAQKNITYIESSSSVTADGYLIISVGNKPNYSISIDNQSTDYICIDNCLWIVPIGAGNHSIKVVDNSPSYNSVILAIISILSILFSVVLFKKYSIILALKRILKKPYRFFKENYVYFVTIIITIVMYNIGCLLCSGIPFGKLSILASDGYVQTYPRIQYMIDHLSLKSLIPSSIGFSTFIFSCGSDTISSTIGTLINLFYRLFIWTNDGRLYGAILSAYYMTLSGPGIIFYLTHRYSGKRFNKRNPYLILIALCYTLSAYVIGYYSFNNFLYSIYTPIIIYALERMIYKKKPLLYVFALSFIMIRGYYSAFLLCEFIGLFFLTLDFENIKDFLKKGVSFLITSLLAAGIGAFNLLPAFLSTMNSPYRESDSVSTDTITIGSSIFKTFNQYQIGQDSVVMSTDNGMVNIYSGLIPLIFIGIYVLDTKIKLSTRIRKVIICTVLFWAFGDTILNFVFHGFHFQSNVPNRFSMFFTFLLITIFADVFQDFKSISKKKTLISICTAGLLLILFWIIYPEKKTSSFALSIVFTLTYIGITIYYYFKEIDKAKFVKLLAYFSAIEVLLSSTMLMFSSFGHLNAPLEDNINSIKILSKDFNNSKTNDIFISEYIEKSLDNYNTGLITDLTTIRGFNSELNSQTSDLVDGWGINVSDNNIKYGTGNPIADMMLHVKYQFIDTDSDEYGKASIYNKIATHNNIELYENPYFLPVGFMTEENLSKWGSSNLEEYTSFMDYINSFSQSVCGKDVFDEISPSGNNSEDSYFNTSLSEMSIYGTYDIGIDVKLEKTINGDLYVFYGNNVDYIGSTDKTTDNIFNFTIHDYIPPSDDAQLELTMGLLNREVLKEMHDIFAESELKNIKKTNNYFSGDIDVKKSGIMYFSLPCYDNMNIYVDGKLVDHFKYLYGTGINLEEGNHTIKVEGITKNYHIGVIISVISLLLLLLLNLFNKKYYNRIFNNKTKKDYKKTMNEKETTKSKKSKRINKTYLLAFIIPLIMVIISMIRCGFAPFGPRDVLTANDESNILRYFYEFYDRVHSGRSIFAYSMHEGTGYDFTTILTYYLSDPTNLLVLLFPRGALLSILNGLYIIKVSLSSLFMCIYLSNTNIKPFKSVNHNNNNKAKKDTKKKNLLIGGTEEAPSFINKIMEDINLPILALSLIYPFSNYMLGPGFNVTSLGAVMIFPLLILGLEKLIFEQKKKLYVAMYALTFMLYFRIAIITTIFMILYLFVVEYKDKNHIITALKNKILCDIVVIIVAAVYIFNNIWGIFWTNDITSLDKPNMAVSVFDVIKMMTTGIKPASILLAGNNIYMYSGIVTLLFVLCFAFNDKIKLSTRIKYICLYILLFCGFIVTSLNTILNGFIYYDGLISIFAYSFIFLSIVISYIELKYIKGQSTTRLGIPALLSAGLVVGSLFLCESYDTPSTFMKSLEFIFFYSIIIIIYCDKSLTKWLMKISISLIIIIELSISYFPSMKMLSWYTYPYTNLNTYKESEALNELEKKEPRSKNLIIHSSSSDHTPLEVALLGYDNVIWSSDNVYKNLEYNTTIDNIDIYKTNTHDSYLLDKSIQGYSYNKYSPIESINTLSENYLKTPITMQPVLHTAVGGNYANNTNYIYIEPSESGDLFYNYSYISNLNDVKEGETAEFVQYVNKNRQRYKKGLYRFSIDDYNSTINSLEGYDIEVNNLSNSDFKISASNDGYITLGLKNRPGWNVRVNNNKVKPTTFLEDGMIIPVTKGENNISIRYTPIIFIIGLILSIISTTLVLIITYKRIKTKAK